jgi:hypothetical protein
MTYTPSIYMDLEDATLIDAWRANVKATEEQARERHIMEAELMRRMQERGATEIVTEEATCVIDFGVEVDYNKLKPLLELESEERLKDCYFPAHKATVEVPEKWNMTKTKALGKVGGETARHIGEAQTRYTKGVRITEKEGKR